MAQYELSSENPVDMDVLTECFATSELALRSAKASFEIRRRGGGLLGGGVGMVTAIIAAAEGIHAVSAVRDILLALLARRPAARITIRVAKREVVITSEGVTPEALGVLLSELGDRC